MYKRPYLNEGELRHYLVHFGIDAAMKKFGMSRQTLKRFCERNQIQLRGPGRPPIVLSPNQEQWIIDYRANANLGYQKISRVSGRYDQKSANGE